MEFIERLMFSQYAEETETSYKIEENFRINYISNF